MTGVRVDDDARAEIRGSLDATLFVEAGAGTGKTTALVSRVVGFVASGLALRCLAAITFTEAAASELRDRIRLELERAARGDSDPPLSQHEQGRCRAALGELDDAALGTLHGFAQRVLVEYPLEAGLPPRFDVLDDVEARIGFEKRWRDFVDRLFTDATIEPALLRALGLGLRERDLHGIARTMHENADRLPAAEIEEPPPPVLDVTCVLDPLESALALASCCTDDDDRLARHLDGLSAYRDELAACVDELDLLDLLASPPTIDPGRMGNQGNWNGRVSEVRGLLARAEDGRADLVDRARRAALGALVARVREFVLEFADERRRSGRLEFHDLLVLARDVLRSHSSARAALARRFSVLLVDEFQDTDPLQIELAVLLATADPSGGDKPWHEVAIEPGRLFLVGDPKQSIYRFRRADLGLYRRVEQRLREQRRVLQQNFRSVPGVLEWVNHVFGQLFATPTTGVGSDEQVAHVDLHPWRPPLPDGPRPVHTFGGPVEGERIGQVREREAADVTALVRRIKGEGWPIVDPVTHAVRPAGYGDIGLLIPTRTALGELEDALEAGDVPVRIESQSLVYSTPEVRDLLAILTAIDDPTDEVALVAALRAPAFGCGDDELAEFRLAGGRWDYRRPVPTALSPTHRVLEALAALRALHEARWWRSVSETLAALVRERRLLELATTHRRPRDHWRRLRFLLDSARAYDESGARGRGLRGFIEFVQQQADERARAVEVVVPEPDDDALRVLTVHGAKGLEFPIVILAGLNAEPPTWRYLPVLWADDGSLEVCAGTKKSSTRVETPGYTALYQREQQLDQAERTRLLYVAATRARDYLLVSLHHKAGSRCHAAELWSHRGGAPAGDLDLTPSPTAGEGELEARDAPARGAQPRDERAAWIAARDELLARAGRAASVAATALAQDGPGVDGELDGENDELPAWRRGRAGTSVGRAVHAVLQSIDLATGAGLEATARAQALAEGIPSREHEVAALARSVLDAPVVRDAARHGRYWREVPVAATVDGVTVEGFVDLLVESEDGLVVVDYKTDRVPSDAELDAAMERYRVQAGAYALALERVLGRPVARCVFVFARRVAARQRIVDDLPATIAQVERRIAALAT